MLLARNRSARVGALGAPRQRSTGTPGGSSIDPRRRRIVVVGLAVVSLVLLSVYFRESSGGALHRAQSTGASILYPFQVAADRIAQPFEDGAGWLGDVLDAKSDNKKLRTEVDRLRQQVVQNQTAARQNAELRRLLRYRDGPAFPRDYRGVTARIIGRTPGQFEQQVVIAAGSNSGILVNDPVVTPDGLVGKVTKVAKRSSRVTLLTDETSAVSALDLRTNAAGIVRHGVSSGDTLVLDRVTKEQVVRPGDAVITAGWRSGKLASIYPRGIPIGVVTFVGQLDTDIYKQVEVDPLVDFTSLDSVLVLVDKPKPKKAATKPLQGVKR
jgi:rod shape-determining protein MreC